MRRRRAPSSPAKSADGRLPERPCAARILAPEPPGARRTPRLLASARRRGRGPAAGCSTSTAVTPRSVPGRVYVRTVNGAKVQSTARELCKILSKCAERRQRLCVNNLCALQCKGDADCAMGELRLPRPGAAGPSTTDGTRRRRPARRHAHDLPEQRALGHRPSTAARRPRVRGRGAQVRHQLGSHLWLHPDGSNCDYTQCGLQRRGGNLIAATCSPAASSPAGRPPHHRAVRRRARTRSDVRKTEPATARGARRPAAPTACARLQGSADCAKRRLHQRHVPGDGSACTVQVCRCRASASRDAAACLVCLSAGVGDADGHCTTSRTAPSDSNCPGGYACGKVRDARHPICGATPPPRSPGSAASPGNQQRRPASPPTARRQRQHRPLEQRGRLLPGAPGGDVPTPARAAPPTPLGPLLQPTATGAAIRKACTTPAPSTSTARPSASCTAWPWAAPSFCAADCGSDVDCPGDFQCTSGECVPRAGSCTGTKTFCEPCHTDDAEVRGRACTAHRRAHRPRACLRGIPRLDDCRHQQAAPSAPRRPQRRLHGLS